MRELGRGSGWGQGALPLGAEPGQFSGIGR